MRFSPANRVRTNSRTRLAGTCAPAGRAASRPNTAARPGPTLSHHSLVKDHACDVANEGLLHLTTSDTEGFHSRHLHVNGRVWRVNVYFNKSRRLPTLAL